MGMTIAEKIISRHAGREARAGELVVAEVDFIMGQDGTSPLAIQAFREMGGERVLDPERVALVIDHSAPSPVEGISNLHALMREFASEQGVRLYDVGWGVCHCLLPEQGHVAPGDLVVGADSHTCTYGALGAFSTGVGSTDLAMAWALGEIWLRVPKTLKFVYKGRLRPWVGGKDLILYTIGKIGVDGALYRAMEFSGPVVEELSMDARFTMANMAIEAGAKNGIFHVDDVTREWLKGRAEREYLEFSSDPDAEYERVYEFDVSELEPQVALPHLPSNVKPVTEVGEVEVDQVVIGSCTNGRLEDMEVAWRILKGKKVHPRVRLLVFPGSQEIIREMASRGWLESLVEAGAVISPPTCGPCLGGHMGVLAAGERAVSTTNRNFVGRMGHRDSEVYLAGPAVAAATAVLGRIAHPEEVA